MLLPGRVFAQLLLKTSRIYNFHVLGLGQTSRNRAIIEAKNAWDVPEIKTWRNHVWRGGDEWHLSYVNSYPEPIVRTKILEDGKMLLIVARHPHLPGVAQVRIGRPRQTEECKLELVDDFPIIMGFPIAAP